MQMTRVSLIKDAPMALGAVWLLVDVSTLSQMQIDFLVLRFLLLGRGGLYVHYLAWLSYVHFMILDLELPELGRNPFLLFFRHFYCLHHLHLSLLELLW